MRRFLSLGLLCLMLLGTAVSAQAQSSSSTPDDQAALALLTALDVDSYRDKGEAITAILQSDDERARDWLQALLDGRRVNITQQDSVSCLCDLPAGHGSADSPLVKP